MPSTSHVVSTLHGEELRRTTCYIILPFRPSASFSLSFVLRDAGPAWSTNDRPSTLRHSTFVLLLANHVPEVVFSSVKNCFVSFFHPSRLSLSLSLSRALQAFNIFVSRDPTERRYFVRGEISSIFKVSVVQWSSVFFFQTIFFFCRLLAGDSKIVQRCFYVQVEAHYKGDWTGSDRLYQSSDNEN